MANVYINRISAYLPNDPVDNNDMESILGQVGDRPSRARRTILRSNGIQQRYYAIDRTSGLASHTNAQLTAEAVQLLDGNGFDIRDIDCLACGTTQADQIMPNHAVMVHGELDIPPCEVVATAGVCTAGVMALKYAYMGIASGEFDNAVATGSETASAVMRAPQFQSEVEAMTPDLQRRPELAFEKDFLRWMLSDGAGALLLQPRPREQGISLRIDWIAQRSYANEMPACMYSGADKLADGRLRGWKEYTPQEWLDDSIFAIKQDVKLLNENIIHYTVERPLHELKALKQLQAQDVDYFLPHYSSNFFRDRVYQGLVNADFEIPYERWFSNLTTRGNTGSASIFLMLEELLQQAQLSNEQRILCYVPESGRFSSAFIHLTVCDPGHP